MLCENPYLAGPTLFPCGNCMPCKISHRRVWTHRILLESLMHGDNSFVTLTYEDSNVKELEPSHVTDWLKRLRRSFEPEKLRFYLVGEYGDASLRPHYHAALFGYPQCLRGNTRIRRGEKRVSSCCYACEKLQKTWPDGIIYSGSLEPKSAAYIAGYVTKKMTHRHDPRLQGKHPEFARMSLRPGIGYQSLHEVASTLMSYDLEEDDVPVGLRHGKKIMPLGRYLRKNLRLMTGSKDGKAPVDEKRKAEMLALLCRSIANEVSIKAQAISENKGRSAALVSRSKLYKPRESI